MGREGLIVGLVTGIAALIISVIIALVIITNVATVDDNIATAISGNPVINETGAYINTTGYTLAQAGLSGFAPTITALFNATDDTVIGTGNVTVTNGIIYNATANHWNDVLVSYTYTYTATEGASDRLIANFTAGIDNVSGKIPTILLIAAVVLILSILVLLWSQYQRMNIGGGSEL